MAWIKKIYLYLVSLISLIILVVASIMLINMALKAWVFKKADLNIVYSPQIACTVPATPDGKTSNVAPECSDPNYRGKMEQQQRDERAAQRQRDASQAIAMVIVALPVFLYHWRLARREA